MPDFDIQSIHATNLAGLLDQPLLAALDLQPRTLLTRDVNSVPDFLKEWLRQGKTHGGVNYVSNRFRQNILRAVIRALANFLKAHGDEDWGLSQQGSGGPPGDLPIIAVAQARTQ